jgi:voltage-gated potassium channel Kch
MAIVILSTILKAKKVTTETIYASICVYLLLGIIWTMLFSAIEIIEPGSFLSGGEPVVDFHGDPVKRNVLGILIYYSFVTLTTLGYGDIIPASPHARALSSLEAVIGQLFIAVLIARLVGLHIAHSIQKDS